MNRIARATILLIFSSSLLASAQARNFSVTLSSGHTPESTGSLQLALDNLRWLGLRLATQVHADSSALALGLGASYNSSFGPLGNVRLNGQAFADTRGHIDVRLGGSGVIANVAARASLLVFNVNPEYFQPLERAERPRYDPQRLDDAFAVGLGLGGTYRLQRLLLADLDPSVVYVSGSGLGGQLQGSLQFRRFRGDDDMLALLLASLEPGAAQGFVSSGLEYRWNRRNQAIVHAALLFGVGSEGIYPGARLMLRHQDRASGLQGQLEVAAEPFRSDASRYRARSELSLPFADGRLSVHSAVRLEPQPDVAGLVLGLRYSWSF